ncbi:TPA: fimbrial protein [Citrobacter sedlakii]|uniref:fimbrial protein n=1 Tax=Citrobacter TaxID=544 RepID=UPI0019018BA7|nr:fimbrial protein [Citrobacter sedlakii]EKX8507683.1 fimbrial protein [Citrobacter sedlakii]MBJ9888393.1 fimbrial protein [Citrobacter sedlakii]MCK8144413.1 fimbrial protein [Citrobacter sedlakii]HCA7081180.1 fimbrial protein [Citrobacter sedlakii]HCA7137536.1 fimbrial protein [Citrobacter sedlakii]
MFRLVLVAIAAPFLISVTALANNEQKITSGTIHFYGEVTSGSCAIDAESTQQTIPMDQVTTSSFSGPGSWASPTVFWIKLENCSLSTTQFARVAFTGQADAVDPQVFQTGIGASAVKGVGVGIFDAQGKLLVPNTAPESALPLQEGKNILSFTAKYRATTTNIVPGEASTAVNFSIIYQ